MNAILNLIIWATSVVIAFSAIQIGFHFSSLNGGTGWKKWTGIAAKVCITLLLWPYVTSIISVLLTASTGLSSSGWAWLQIFIAVFFVSSAGFLIIRYWKSALRDAVVLPATAIIDAVAVYMILAAFGVNATAEIDGSFSSWTPTLILVGLLSWLSVGFQRPAFLSSLVSWGMASITVVIALVCADLVYLQASGQLTKVGLLMQKQTAEAIAIVNAEAEGRQYDRFQTAQIIFQAARVVYDSDPTDENSRRMVEAAKRLNEIQTQPIEKITVDPLPAIAEQQSVVGKTVETVKTNGIVGGTVKGLWKVAFGDTSLGGNKKEWLSQPVTLEKGEVVETVAIPDRSTVYFESNKSFYIVERTGMNDDGSEKLVRIKMPVGVSKRFFTWGGTVKLEGMFDGMHLTIKY